MKTSCGIRYWILLPLTLLALLASAQDAEVSARLSELKRAELLARGNVERAVSALRKAEAEGTTELGELRRTLAQEESALRRAVASRLVVQASGPQASETLAKQYREAQQRETETRQLLSDYLAGGLAQASGSERETYFLNAEATLRAQRLESEVVAEAFRRSQPLRQAGANDPRGRTRINETTDRLDNLLLRIATTDADEKRPDSRSASQHEAEMWLRARTREMDVEEYQRIARGGQFISEKTGQPISGTQRERLALDAEKQLAEAVAYHSRDKRFLDFWSSKDTRKDLADRLQSEVNAVPEYQALNYLSPNQDSMPSYYLALANAVRRGQSDVDYWYTHEYLGQKSETGQSAAGAWWKTGFGTLARANDISGETSRAHVEGRLNAMRQETDAAAEAFTAAANIRDPAQLPSTQRELLKAYGYLAEGPDKKLRYTLPSGQRGLGQLTRADLPGASWMDALSMETVAVTAASVALPELAGARVAAWATRAGLTTRSTAIATTAANLAANTAVDVGAQLLQTGTVEWDKTLLDNLVVGGAIGKAAGVVSEGLTGAGGRLLKDTRLAKALKDSTHGPSMVRDAEALVRNALGLSSESALQSYYQSLRNGNPGLTYEDFLANVTTGAMGRAMSGHRQARAKDYLPYERVVATLTPEGRLRDALVGSSALALEERGRARDYAESNRQTWERFMRATENGQKVDVTTIGRAMRDGEFSWADLKVVAADAPEALRPIHEAMAKEREKFYGQVDKLARSRALDDLNEEYASKLAAVEKGNLSPEAKLAQRQKLIADRDAELKLINEKESRLGSDAASSDIDRSWKSDRVRKAAKEVEEALLYQRDQDRPGPTSARVFDLNEYYDVMPFIKDSFGGGKTPDGKPRERIDLSKQEGVEVGGRRLTHPQTMEATSLAAAMMHMDEAQRARFEKNQMETAPAERRQALADQFAWAKDSLTRETQALKDRAAKIAVETGRKADDPDVLLTARDQVYGERTRELQALESRINQMPDPKSPEALALRAQWEQKMGVALREGIETYSQAAGLDLICNTLQGEFKTNPDGSRMMKDGKPVKRTARELMADTGFNINGRLKDKYTSQQLDGMLNDQVMFLMEHVNGYREGHESAETAARAIGKYGERALLALSVMGENVAGLPDGHPLKKLYQSTEQLVKFKDDPAKLREYLAGLDSQGDPDRGLRLLLNQVEGIPGMQGLTGPGARKDANAQALAGQAARRRWERERDEARMLGGAAGELEVARQQQRFVEDEQARLKQRQQGQQALDASYLRKDQTEAQRLVAERGALEERLQNLPGGAENTTATAQELRKEIARRDQRLAELRKSYADAGSPVQTTEEDDLRSRRLAELDRQKNELTQTCGTLEAQADQERKERGLASNEPVSPNDELVSPFPAASTSGTNSSPARPDDGLPLPNRPDTTRPQPDGTDWGGPQTAGNATFKMRVSQTRYRIGQKLQVAYQVAEGADTKVPRLGLFNSTGSRVASQSLTLAGKEAVLDLPALAGDLVLRASDENDRAIAELPIGLVVTPAPGAIRLEGGRDQPIGSKGRVTLNVPAGFYQNQPWIGLWSINRTGGRSPYRVQWWRAKDLKSPLSIEIPVQAGDYELRLYDRDEVFYQLDTLAFRAVVVPAPGALKIAKREYLLGEPVEVLVDVPENVYLHPGDAWVGLYDISRAEKMSADAPPRITYQWVKKKGERLRFTPPDVVGSWELRLYDRNSSPYRLDVTRFVTRQVDAPGSLKTPANPITVGSEFKVALGIPSHVHLGNWAYVSLHHIDGGVARGEVAPQLQKHYVSRTNRNVEVTFTAPDYPGQFQVRLYDRENNGFLLDASPVQVVVHRSPGALSLGKGQFAPGERIVATVRLAEGVRLFSYPTVGLYPVARRGMDARPDDLTQLAHAYVDAKSMTVTLTAPVIPGRYQARLFDREATFNRLDSVVFEVAQPPARGALSSPPTGVAGSELSVNFSVPSGVYLGSWSGVWLYEPKKTVAGGAWADERSLAKAYLGESRSGAVKIRLPGTPGRYELRLYDRENDGLILDQTVVEVTPPPPN